MPIRFLPGLPSSPPPGGKNTDEQNLLLVTPFSPLLLFLRRVLNYQSPTRFWTGDRGLSRPSSDFP